MIIIKNNSYFIKIKNLILILNKIYYLFLNFLLYKIIYLNKFIKIIINFIIINWYDYYKYNYKN